MKKILHVNRNVIDSNRKHGTNKPAITYKTYKSNEYGHQAVIKDKNGNVVGKFIYSPHKPLSCGARLWFEISEDCEVEMVRE
jgi:hypothetical protein